MSVPVVMGSVTVRRPGGWDDTGDPLPAVEHQVPDCAWWPTTSEELTDLRHTVIAGYMLTCQDQDADIRSTDEVLLPDVLDDDGEVAVWTVNGEIGRWADPLGFQLSTAGMQCALRRSNG